MKASNLLEILSASHLTHYVSSQTHDRGGIMMVAPPGSLKSTVSLVVDQYPKSVVVADLTIRQAANLRSDMLSSRLVTLCFSDFAKLYQRQSSIASNIEGFIRGITGEGYRNVNWEDSRIIVQPARCLVIGCMTPQLYTAKYGGWMDDGLARRFLWSHFSLAHESERLLVEALRKGTRLELSIDGFNPRVPLATLKENVTDKESRELLFWLKDQPDVKIGIVLLRRILTVLKWKFSSEPRKPMRLLEEFALSLSKQTAVLYLE